MRFLNRDGREPSESILAVGVERAFDSVYWDEKAFIDRGGIYDWSRQKTSCTKTDEKMNW